MREHGLPPDNSLEDGQDKNKGNNANIPPGTDLNTLSLDQSPDYLNKWNEYRITSQSNYPTPNPIISINGESIATAGNIMAISGLQKSGKSSLSNIILSGAIREIIWDGVPAGFFVSKSIASAIIHIDTEQAKHRHLSNLKYGILKRVGRIDEPDYFYSYNVRGLDIQKATELLNEVFSGAAQKHGSIHFALIDGIADFVTGVNEDVECSDMVKTLETLATEYNTLVIVVIHRNPNDSKVRGHLGSHLLRKCEAILTVKKENDCTYIDPDELRTAAKNDIPKYLFQFDKSKGYHVCIGEMEKGDNTNSTDQCQNFVDNILKEGVEYQRKKLLELLCQKLNIKTDMAQKKIKLMTENEMIMPGAKKGLWKKVSNDSLEFDTNAEQI